MILYIDKYIGKGNHIATSWYVITENSKDTKYAVYSVEKSTEYLTALLLTIPLDKNKDYWIYAIRHLDTNENIDISPKKIVPEKYTDIAYMDNKLGVETPTIKVSNNTLSTNSGELKIKVSTIRPISNVFKLNHLVLIPNTREYTFIKDYDSYEIVVTHNDVDVSNVDYFDIYVATCNTNNVISKFAILREDISIIPPKLINRKGIDPLQRYYPIFKDLGNYVVERLIVEDFENSIEVDIDGKYIPAFSLDYNNRYMIGIYFKKDGHLIRKDFYIETAKSRIPLPIDEEYIYSLFYKVSGETRLNRFSVEEELSYGSTITVEPIEDNKYKADIYMSNDTFQYTTTLELDYKIDFDYWRYIKNITPHLFVYAYRMEGNDNIILTFISYYRVLENLTIKQQVKLDNCLSLSVGIDVTRLNIYYVLREDNDIYLARYNYKTEESETLFKFKDEYNAKPTRYYVDVIEDRYVLIMGDMETLLLFRIEDEYVEIRQYTPNKLRSANLFTLKMINNSIAYVSYDSSEITIYDFYNDKYHYLNAQKEYEEVVNIDRGMRRRNGELIVVPTPIRESEYKKTYMIYK